MCPLSDFELLREPQSIVTFIFPQLSILVKAHHSSCKNHVLKRHRQRHQKRDDVEAHMTASPKHCTQLKDNYLEVKSSKMHRNSETGSCELRWKP